MTRTPHTVLRSVVIGALTVLLGRTAVAAQQAPVRPLSIDDALHTHQFEATTAIRVAKGGRYVAYTVTNPDRVGARDARHDFFSAGGVPLEMEGCEVWVADTRTGAAENVSDGARSSWGPTWSPDGHSLAFYSDRAGVVQLWIWDVETKRLRRPTSAVAHEISGLDPARWLPDGSGLVIKINPEGVDLAHAFPSQGSDTARLTGDSGATVVVYRSKQVPTPSAPSTPTRIAPRSIGSVLMSDLAVVDLESGRLRRIVRQKPVEMYDVSPAGGYVAYSTYDSTGTTRQQPYVDIWIVSTKTGESRAVARNVPQLFGRNMSWSPDGDRLAFVVSGYGTDFSDARQSGDCFVVAADGGGAQNVTTGSHPRFDHALRKPIWNMKGDAIYLFTADEIWSASADGHGLRRVARVPGREIKVVLQTGEEGLPWSPSAEDALYVSTFDSLTKQVGFARIEPESGAVRQLIKENKLYSVYAFGFAAEGDDVYFEAEDAQHPPEIWRAHGEDFEHARQLTHVNAEAEGYAYGEQRLIHWRNDDGRTLSGALLLPAQYQAGHRYPLVVDVYAGSPMSNDVYAFGMGVSYVFANWQLLATRGFAVLIPDIPLQGVAPMREIAADVLPGINRVVELGIADPDRVGVFGQSYGGYSTLALIVQTQRFKAAVSVSGFSDLFSQYSSLQPTDDAFAIGWAEHGQGRMYGSPWEVRDRYIENSPFFYLDRARTPLLLVHGSLDPTVPPFLADQTFVALRRLGQEVEYAKYIGENHGIMGTDNVRDYTARVISWFEQHLTPTTTQSPASR